MKRKKYHTCKDVLLPVNSCEMAADSLLRRTEKIVVVAADYAFNQNKGDARHSGTLFNTSTSTGETSKKRPAVHFT